MEMVYSGFKCKLTVRRQLRPLAYIRSNRLFSIGIKNLDSQDEMLKTIWKRQLCSSFSVLLHLRVLSGRFLACWVIVIGYVLLAMICPI